MDEKYKYFDSPELAIFKNNHDDYSNYLSCKVHASNMPCSSHAFHYLLTKIDSILKTSNSSYRHGLRFSHRLNKKIKLHKKHPSKAFEQLCNDGACTGHNLCGLGLMHHNADVLKLLHEHSKAIIAKCQSRVSAVFANDNMDAGGERETRWLTNPYYDTMQPGTDILIIASTEHMRGMPPRVGNSVDVKAVRTVFANMNYDIIELTDFTKDMLLDKLRELPALYPNPRRLVICIFSHGRDDRVVYDVDGNEIFLDVIQYCIDIQAYPAAAGIPKFFLIQACRGTALPAKKYSQDDTKPIYVFEPKNKQLRFLHFTEEGVSDSIARADIATLYSSSPGFAAVRNPMYGSIVVETFVKQLQQTKYANLAEICTAVISAVVGFYASEPARKMIAVPQFETTLRYGLLLSN